MASRVHLPDDHNHTTECFKRMSDAGPGIDDTVSIVDWESLGHTVVKYLCVAVLSGMAAVRIWGASC